MQLEDLGYHPKLEEYRKQNLQEDLGVARVIAEHRERYRVMDAEGEYEAEIIGNMRYAAKSREDLPAVGDWVAVSTYDTDKVIIHSVFPRTTVLTRQSVGKYGEKQIIACNIDIAWIVQSVDRDFNLNRLERYLTLCYDAKIEPVILLNKTDLVEVAELAALTEKVTARMENIPIIPVNNKSEEGCNELIQNIKKGTTYCLLGSSGVGKSTLINTMAGETLMETSDISSSTNKGRHTTSHRQLHILGNGGIFIDNPGIREVGIADAKSGMEHTFHAIATLTKECKYNNCTHTYEDGCAVIMALYNGEIDKETYQNYLKMEKESEHYALTQNEKRKKDKKFGKYIKDFKKNKKYISNKHEE